MSEQAQEKTQDQVLSDFSQQLQEFMGQVVLMHNRLSELEHAAAYLLSKDPQWIANFNAAVAQEENNESSKEELTLPE